MITSMSNMNTVNDTIAAIATPMGIGAISMVRISGPKTEEIAKKIFSVRSDLFSLSALPQLKSNTAHHGYIYDPISKEILDEVILVFYRNPNTYTGEDLVEISCHGGRVVTNEILSLLLSQGARLANRGEFTQRAFLAGKLDLTQAEAVLDLISAKTARGSRMAVSALSGHLGERIRSVRQELMEVLTRIVAGLDFPEEIGDAPEPEVDDVVKRSLAQLNTLVSTARTGKFLREGLKVAIVGRPNAGKSSLLNALLKYDRAIVTDIPGTTRDSLEEPMDLNGIPVIVVDTAGVRDTDDPVEKIGIERTRRAIAEADLVCLLVDLTEGIGSAEEVILESIGAKPYILIANKMDVAEKTLPAHNLTTGAVERIPVSAKTGQNIHLLLSGLESWVSQDNAAIDGPSLNARQEDLCRRAASSLAHVKDTLEAAMPQDCLASDLKIAVDALSEVSGDQVTEEVITSVFAQFCIGK